MSIDKLGAMRTGAVGGLIPRIKSNFRSNNHANLTNVTNALKAKGKSNDEIQSIIRVLRKKGTTTSYSTLQLRKAAQALHDAGVLKSDQSVSTVASSMKRGIHESLEELKTSEDQGGGKIIPLRSYAKERRNEELDEKRKHGLIEKDAQDEKKHGLKPVVISHTFIPEPHSASAVNPSPVAFSHPNAMRPPSFNPNQGAQKLPPQIVPPTIHPSSPSTPPSSPSQAA